MLSLAQLSRQAGSFDWGGVISPPVCEEGGHALRNAQTCVLLTPELSS